MMGRCVTWQASAFCESHRRQGWRLACLTLRHVQEENEDEENLLDQLSSLLSAIMKKYGDAAMPLVDLLMPSVAPLLAPNRSAEERRIALCLLDDILEFSPAGARHLLSEICQLPRRMCAGGRCPKTFCTRQLR